MSPSCRKSVEGANLCFDVDWLTSSTNVTCVLIWRTLVRGPPLSVDGMISLLTGAPPLIGTIPRAEGRSPRLNGGCQSTCCAFSGRHVGFPIEGGRVCCHGTSVSQVLKPKRKAQGPLFVTHTNTWRAFRAAAIPGISPRPRTALLEQGPCWGPTGKVYHSTLMGFPKLGRGRTRP